VTTDYTVWNDERKDLGEIRRSVEGVGEAAAGHNNVALAQRKLLAVLLPLGNREEARRVNVGS
jgi:hypothetical protein